MSIIKRFEELGMVHKLDQKLMKTTKEWVQCSLANKNVFTINIKHLVYHLRGIYKDRYVIFYLDLTDIYHAVVYTLVGDIGLALQLDGQFIAY